MTNLDDAHMIAHSSPTQPKKRGRPKCFNEQQALEKAMLLFWEHGYEATSINDLTQALEITAPSLYGSFGDKAALFYKSIDYYLAHEACPIGIIFKQARTAKIAFELYLYDNVKRLLQPNKPKGCMLVTAAMNGSEQVHQVQQNLLEKRLATKQLLYQRLVQGVEEGDIASTTSLKQMNDFYCTVIQGLTVQARDGAQVEELNQVVKHAMKAWDFFDNSSHDL